MKKHRYIMLTVLFTLLFVISACTNSNVSNAFEVAEKYKLAELESPQISEVTDQLITEKYEVMEPLTTETFHDRSTKTRLFITGSQLAQKKDSEVHLTNLEFTERNVAETQIELDYTGTLSMAEDTLDLEGTIYLLKEANEWRVNNDVYNIEDILNILMER
ncbi:hypothetical protein [Paenibacillus sp. 453mf]|uniref:hypothetical protein n=1 Tax=Paenibacillus sp. 453mf TaxID=1761874 RepID=UPI0008F34A98|nr:hypothetical protein [Paenibacillus sp. 453mf]SFS56072.1 hypothetical protein SAMN04488601_1011719 [Paenibacillus sp. 453mf]